MNLIISIGYLDLCFSVLLAICVISIGVYWGIELSKEKLRREQKK